MEDIIMVNVDQGVIDLKLLEVEDIIDVTVLQDFLDNFAIGMNCAAVSVNRKGEEITKPSHYRKFCSNFIHKSSIGDQRCAQCHNEFGENSVASGKPYVGTCHAGLIDFATPIMILGEHLGTVLGGQILDAQPKENRIREVASELHLDETSLWTAAQSIDVVDKKNIVAAAEVLNLVVNAFAENGYNRLEIQIVSKELTDNFLQISETVDLLAQSAQSITEDQHTLSTRISEIGSVTHEIAEVLTAITKVADKTKLIGINASIEAARLGNDGRGFSVVAKEIQNLSESSKKTAFKIKDLNTLINDRINLTMENSKDTMNTTEDQSAAKEELSATVQNTVVLAERLRELFI